MCFFFSSSVKWWPKQKLFSRLLYRGKKKITFFDGDFFFLFQSDGYSLFSSIFYWRWKRNFIYYFFLSGYYNVYKKKKKRGGGWMLYFLPTCAPDGKSWIDYMKRSSNRIETYKEKATDQYPNNNKIIIIVVVVILQQTLNYISIA